MLSILHRGTDEERLGLLFDIADIADIADIPGEGFVYNDDMEYPQGQFFLAYPQFESRPTAAFCMKDFAPRLYDAFCACQLHRYV
jgi:hypothetical protein